MLCVDDLIVEEKMESSISTSPYFIHQEEVVVDVNFPPPIQRKSSTTSQHSDYQDQGMKITIQCPSFLSVLYQLLLRSNSINNLATLLNW